MDTQVFDKNTFLKTCLGNGPGKIGIGIDIIGIGINLIGIGIDVYR